ncbi:MAG: hypothetical protein H7833_06305 [Magnetococcus sp. DMHC-1]
MPDSWGLEKRWRLEHAARRAGVSVIRFVSESSAALLWRAFNVGSSQYPEEIVDVAILLDGAEITTDTTTSAYGALLLAGTLTGWASGPLLLEVTPVQFEVRTEHGPFVLIPRRTTIPARKEGVVSVRGPSRTITLHCLASDETIDVVRRIRLPVMVPAGCVVDHRVVLDVAADQWVCVRVENMENGSAVTRPFLTRRKSTKKKFEESDFLEKVTLSTECIYGILPITRWHKPTPRKPILSAEEIDTILRTVDEFHVNSDNKNMERTLMDRQLSRRNAHQCWFPEGTTLTAEEVDALVAGLEEESVPLV